MQAVVMQMPIAGAAGGRAIQLRLRQRRCCSIRMAHHAPMSSVALKVATTDGCC
jgi:hypothetical protein